MNDPEKRKAIRNFITTERVDLVCLQETKIQDMSKVLAHSIGVGKFLDWKALNKEGNEGDTLLVWDKRRLSLVESEVGSFSVSCLFRWQRMASSGSFPRCMALLEEMQGFILGRTKFY